MYILSYYTDVLSPQDNYKSVHTHSLLLADWYMLMLIATQCHTYMHVDNYISNIRCHCLCCRINEACVLLCLRVGSALLLRDVLMSDDSEPEKEQALQDLGVYKLAPQVALNVLNYRTNLSVT